MFKRSTKSGRMTQAAYASEGGTRCPYCRSFDVHQGRKLERDDEKSLIVTAMRCYECGKGWSETYKLVGYQGD